MAHWINEEYDACRCLLVQSEEHGLPIEEAPNRLRARVALGVLGIMVWYGQPDFEDIRAATAGVALEPASALQADIANTLAVEGVGTYTR